MATWKLSKSDVILLMAAMAPFMKSATRSGLCSSRWLLMLIARTEQQRYTLVKMRHNRTSAGATYDFM